MYFVCRHIQAYEDVLRHRADKEVNLLLTHRINDHGVEEVIKSQDIHVRDQVARHARR